MHDKFFYLSSPGLSPDFRVVGLGDYSHITHLEVNNLKKYFL